MQPGKKQIQDFVIIRGTLILNDNRSIPRLNQLMSGNHKARVNVKTKIDWTSLRVPEAQRKGGQSPCCPPIGRRGRQEKTICPGGSEN